MKQQVGCEVFFDLNSKDKLIVYNDSKKSKKLKEVTHDFDNEDYIIIKLLSSNDSMYQVDVSYSIAGFVVKGWISRNNSLFVFSRAYEKDLLLYDSPKSNSKHRAIEYTVSPLKVIGSNACWLKIEIVHDCTRITGWIPPESQCANPYTTCN